MSTPSDLDPVAFAVHRLSRRHALTRLGAGGIGLALASRHLGAAAQGASPTAAGTIPDIMQRWVDAFNGDDPVTEVDALYTADGVFEDVSTLDQSEPGAVGEFIGQFVSQVSDLRYELTSGFRTDTWGAGEGTYAFRYTGQLPGLPPGSGEEVLTRVAVIFEFEGEKIRRSSDYSNGTGFLIALGLVSFPDAEPAATPQS
jgi:hypothetical protein